MDQRTHGSTVECTERCRLENVVLSLRDAPDGMALVEVGNQIFIEWTPDEEQNVDSPYEFQIVAFDGSC